MQECGGAFPHLSMRPQRPPPRVVVTEQFAIAPRPTESAESRKPTPGPAYRLAALAARALGFGDATFALVDGSVQGVMASTTRRSDPTARSPRS